MRVALVNTGGVSGFSQYPPFLYRMFSDVRVLPLPPLPRKVVAVAIALFRAPVAYRKYRAIGGSPILDIMREQARLLSAFTGWEVLVGCLYSRPLVEELHEDCVIVPQYPHFSYSTYQAVLDRAGKRRVVAPYYADARFVEAWVEAIERVYRGEYLLFVAHGVPELFLLKGDPYYRQVLESAALVAGAFGVPYRVAFQSRMGPFAWSRPYVEEVLEDLAACGVDRVVVVPISFLNEHLETLYDLDVELREFALGLGFKVYKRVRVPWDSRHLMECWREAVERVAG